ncbi:carbohydrate ABC transporter permease [Paenibacillus sp. J2TS4]|uniref:carbohydrate ABC transporter permease n=1 Tax=Paenibacillus sp. J2TS4 TaxID=2807194 RepID=UPI001B0EE862|nr:carbohydrate ABC transporter permease [Paenibacillus sp. J2TS4]GIP31050.1 transporter [Paenibacillus sp. J2TS4]
MAKQLPSVNKPAWEGRHWNTSNLLSKRSLRKAKQVILGKEADKGLLFKLFIYVLLLDVAYIYLNPLIYMATTMVKDSVDLLDPAVQWIPRTIYMGTLQDAWDMLKYVKSFMISLGLSTTIAICQTVFCAIAGYAFARLVFPFKKLLMLGLILSFIIPPQVTILPMLIAARELDWVNTLYPILLPALFGHGLKGALFVIIYRQFFSTQPKELEEAARIDGAGAFKVFYRVMMPLARPAIVVVFLFSFVWNWNDSYFPSMFLINSDTVPLSMGISQVSAQLATLEKEAGPSIFSEPLKMGSSFMIILPPILLYIFTQRHFVEGVERTGLVE